MSDYSAPVRDMRFVLNHVVDLPAIAQLDGYDHADGELVDQVLEEAARLAGEVLGPINHSGDRQGSVLENGVVRTPDGFRQAYKQFAEGGWNGVPFDPEFGGGGLPWSVTMALSEMWNAANMSFALCPLLNQGAVDLIHAHASDEQKATYLEKMISGEWAGTMNLTEPAAGSDVGALRSKAEPQADGSYRITGQKIFITYGEHDFTENIIHLVLARTPGAPGGTKGISCFIVPKFLVNPDGSLGKRNDLRCVSLEHKLGIHASPTCVMSYGDDGECVGYLIGEENRGMRYMFTMMNNARLSVGTQGLAIAERAYQQAAAFALERKQGRVAGTPADQSSPIVAHADVRRMLMTMRAYIEAMRALIYTNAEAMDLARRHPDEEVRGAKQAMVELLTPISKGWCTDLGCELTSIGVQVHGGMGFVEETGAAQHMRDARIAPIYEGTNGIQAMDLVFRKLPLQGGEAVRALIDEMRALDGDLAKQDGSVFKSFRAGLDTSTAALATATDWMLGKLQGGDPDDAAAGCAPYLKMFGITVGGYLLARGALAAAAQLSNGATDKPFLEAKLATARFYAEQILPQAAALAGPATEGKETLFAIEAEQLCA